MKTVKLMAAPQRQLTQIKVLDPISLKARLIKKLFFEESDNSPEFLFFAFWLDYLNVGTTFPTP